MSTSKLTLTSPISTLYKKPSTTVEKLQNANIKTLEDLIWTLPRKVIKLPIASEFSNATLGEYFRGNGNILNIQARPNFKARGKGKAMLYNISATVKDSFSNEFISLKWFNCYSSVQTKLSKLESIDFLGVVSEFNEQKQIANPEFCQIGEMTIVDGLRIQYPTISTITSNNIKRIIDKIPEYIWNDIEENLPEAIVRKYNFSTRSESFKYLHGLIEYNKWNEEDFNKARKRLIYEEFFLDQVKISIRKNNREHLTARKINIPKKLLDDALKIYPYKLTPDQSSSLEDVIVDLASGSPMMRLIQGDVGSGKTTIAILSCFFAAKNNLQSAIMCPTEALAVQHYTSTKDLFNNSINIEILLGSTSTKEKERILSDLKLGKIDILIGTHSLFQDSVIFKNLSFCVIDEQHKFGVEQRLKLLAKGDGVHCLIMSATPIPRSLSLTQYGDLDISIIKTMPIGRKGTKTRIVNPETFPKFLSFLKTRIEMGEQAYILVPAINESPDQNIRDLNQTFEKFKDFFPNFTVASLHGQMKSDEKTQVFKDFSAHKIDLLIATSVIEVGINVLNATVMAILNPERFGLSSLHQIRGRVGRGEKPGFCFLVSERALNPETLHRLSVIENNTDGFKIAEEDLKIRGEGDLFGQEQSGIVTQKKIANIVTDQDILYQVISDFKSLSKEKSISIAHLFTKVEADEKILSTI